MGKNEIETSYLIFWVNNIMDQLQALMNQLQAFFILGAFLYFIGVVLYLTLWSLNEGLKAAGKSKYSFFIYDDDPRTDKELLKSEIIHILFLFLRKVVGFFWTIFWYSIKHIFVFFTYFAITYFIFLYLPSRIIPPQFLINMNTISILMIVNTTLLLQSTKENDDSPKLND
ncbi:hypothetical protein QT987_11910 [Microcoleus sp. SVA1B4]|uniref:hypothetical protein n=2 Tax=Microcoleus TaxID=44471 RepID=UPI002FD6196C